MACNTAHIILGVEPTRTFYMIILQANKGSIEAFRHNLWWQIERRTHTSTLGEIS